MLIRMLGHFEMYLSALQGFSLKQRGGILLMQLTDENTFTYRSFYTEDPENPLHTEAFTQKAVYIQEL